MNLYKIPKDLLVNLILLIKRTYEKKIRNLENKLKLCENYGIKFDYCENCEFMEIRTNIRESNLYQCYSCRCLFCESHIAYCEVCEDFMCLDDINTCQEYHREDDLVENGHVF